MVLNCEGLGGKRVVELGEALGFGDNWEEIEVTKTRLRSWGRV